MMIGKVSLLLLLGTALGVHCTDNPEIQTTLGRIKGHIIKSLNGRKIAAFEGIPFAKPPIGELRFEDPEPIEAWKGTWDATKKYSCSQGPNPFFSVQFGSEDCLYLNVYVPFDKLQSADKLDVIVGIHGGAFMLGDGGRISPDQLVDYDVVFVSLNYRLGPFGFLSSGEGTLTGNQGMKDQVEALKWIQAHIEKFNGNPKSVTIGGVSAGAASVHLHLFSPLSRGLFHRAFSESGTALNPWVIAENGGQKVRKLAALVGCNNDNFKYIKSCLKKRPAELLLDKIPQFYEYEYFPFSPFAPTVDAVSSKSFLPTHPIAQYYRRELADVPWLTCTTSEEGIFPGFWLHPKLDELDELWPKMAPYVLDFNYTSPKSQWPAIAHDIKTHYLGEGTIADNFNKFLQILSDRHFVDGADQASKLQARANKSPVYYYVFNYESNEHSFFPSYPGKAHGLNSQFMFGSADKTYSDMDREMIKLMTNILVTFAKDGVPQVEGVTWDPVKGDRLVYLNISDAHDVKLQDVQSLGNREFWTEMNILENERVVLIRDEL